MEDFYLFDSPSAEKLKGLKKEYTNLDVTSVLTYFEIQKAYRGPERLRGICIDKK